MSDVAPRGVSCLALTSFYDYLEARGVPRTRIQEGLPYAPTWLDDRSNWIDWATFLEIERRVRALFPDDPDLFVDIGLSVGRKGGESFVRVLMRAMISPARIYALVPSAIPRFMFPFMTIGIEETGSDRLSAHYVFHPAYAPSDAFLDTIRGILAGLPMISGATPARVEMRRASDLEFHFDIELTRPVGVWQQLGDVWRGSVQRARLRLSTPGEAISELERTNHLLQEKVEALTEAKAQLDERVRDLTLMNTLARAGASELDLRRLLRQAVEIVARELGAPVAVLLAEGTPPALVLAAHRDLDPEALEEIRDLADPENPACAGLVRGPGATTVAGRPWCSLPMESHEQTVGVLLLGIPEGVRDAGVLQSLASQLAVAVENALSFKTIAELRDHLELRVRERTAELEEARTHLEDTVGRLVQADEAKARFFTNVSHELRTPLTLILAPLSELERRVAGDPEARADVDLLKRNATQLLQLVNEILDFARIDAGAMPMDREDLDVAALLDDVVGTLAPLATRKGLLMRWAPAEAAVPVRGDAKLLRRVFVNLLANAVKYTRHGDAIAVAVHADDEFAEISVSDTGPGIDAHEQQLIFERFRRASAQGQGVAEGSGIGLAMASDIVRLHDGTLDVHSEPGQGCVFRVRLPRGGAKAVAPSPDRHAPPPRIAPEAIDLATEEVPLPVALALDVDATGDMASDADAPANGLRVSTRVLVVEDNPDVRGLLRRLLARHHVVVAVQDGLEALEVAAADPPDAIVADVMMPRMGGIELCRRLRECPATRNVPVILLSARHGTEAALEGFEAGADDYVTKPFSTPELLARINAQVRIRTLAQTLLRMEKHASLGVLSAGVAHELLNPVNAVVNAIPALRKHVERAAAGNGPDPARAQLLLDAVEQSGARMNRVIRSILTFTRQEARPRLSVAPLRDAVETTLAILRYRLDRGITVHTDFADDEPVPHYPEWVGQVVLNLVVNALDAMGGGGTIWIATARRGDVATLTVRDDGPGVPRADRDRIFDPFYTTKPPGSGTGLGLAVSREIAHMHGGTLELAPEATGGACFVLTLPLEPLEHPHGEPPPRAAPLFGPPSGAPPPR